MTFKISHSLDYSMTLFYNSMKWKNCLTLFFLSLHFRKAANKGQENCLFMHFLFFICSISSPQSSMRQRMEQLSLQFSPMSIILYVPQRWKHHDCTQTSKDLRSIKDSLFIYLLRSGSEMPFSMIFKVYHYFLFQRNSSSFYSACFIFLPFSSIFQPVPFSVLAKGSSSSKFYHSSILK